MMLFGWSLPFKFSRLPVSFTNPLEIVPSAPIITCITVTFTFYIFLVIKQGQGTYFSLRFLSDLLCDPPDGKLHNLACSLYCWLSLGLVVWSRLGYLVLTQTPRELMRLILRDGFWVFNIPLVCMVKLKLLARFQMDHSPNSVVSSLILFLP